MKYTIIKCILAFLMAVGACLFWWRWHPELISFHEQNQLFLFTGEYLVGRLNVAGGLADYLGEFLVQFFFYIGAGAVIIGLILGVMQLLLSTVIEKLQGGYVSTQLIAIIVTLLMWAHMMDENAMLSYPVAIIITLSTYLLCRRGGWVVQLSASLPLYWCVGPAFVFQGGLAIIDVWKGKGRRQALLVSLLLVGVAIGWIYFCRMVWMAQYPWGTVLSGINYYRLTLMSCESSDSQYAVFFYLVILCGCSVLVQQLGRLSKHFSSEKGQILSVLIILALGVPQLKYAFGENNPHDINTHVLLEQQYLVRKGDWKALIAKAEEYNRQHINALNTPLSANAINLALVKTRQLSSRMFEFPQFGVQGLIMPNVRDNVSNVISMETFWNLGFINEALRYAFDSQECIPNCRKSGRYMRRIAECNIVNGNYSVASKYIDLLKKSLFYRGWAEKAESYLNNEQMIESLPEWAEKRQFRLENDFLYYWPEMHKMLGQLVLRNRQNILAYDYFMASLLLIGDHNSFVANLPQQPKAGTNPFPAGYEKYVEKMHRVSDIAVTDAVTGATSSR